MINGTKKWHLHLDQEELPKKIDGDFLSSGNTVFDMSDIKGIEEMLSEYPPILTKMGGQYREFNEVDPDKEYFIGADCSTGRATDYSSFTCMDKFGEEQVIYKGRLPLDRYAKLLGDTGMKFNNALLAPETNDIGAAVTAMLKLKVTKSLLLY